MYHVIAADLLVFLQILVQAPRVHSIFITGLTFIHPGNCKEVGKNDQTDEVLLSVSADRTCSVTELCRKG